jgi:integrase
MTTRPNINRMAAGSYRLDLRGKAFRSILNTVSEGKKTLEFGTRAVAERKADEIEELLAKYGSKKMENLDAALGLDPTELQKRLDPFGKTIRDAVNFYADYLANLRERESSQTLSLLMDGWISEKKKRVQQGTLSADTFDTLYWKANGENGYKAKWGNRPVGTITPNEIVEYYESYKTKNGLPASQVLKQHLLSYFSQFFRWCQKNHGLKSNPCEFLSVQRNKDAGEVHYYTVEQAQAIMILSTDRRFVSILPFHAICLFSGVRTAECERLTWKNIDFEDGSIVVPKANAKTRHGRRATMQPNLITWLKWFKEKYYNYGLIPIQGFDERKRQFRRNLGFPWYKNGLRHSAASYTLGAKLGDYGYLESNFGNSRAMLEQHYLNFPNKEESLKFWAISPETVLSPPLRHKGPYLLNRKYIFCHHQQRWPSDWWPQKLNRKKVLIHVSRSAFGNLRKDVEGSAEKNIQTPHSGLFPLAYFVMLIQRT